MILCSAHPLWVSPVQYNLLNITLKTHAMHCVFKKIGKQKNEYILVCVMCMALFCLLYIRIT